MGELTKEVRVIEGEHEMNITLLEPMTLPEIWYSIIGWGYRPAIAEMDNGVATIRFGKVKVHNGKRIPETFAV